LLQGIYKTYLNDINYIQKENVKLKLEIEANSDKIAVFTDSIRLKQVLNNLVSNAIKFTDSGEVVIGYRQTNQGGRKLLKFYIKDTGIGIPDERLDIIFNRFNQLVDDRKKSYEGTGLGLSISKKLVDLLGGQLEVNSEEGVGSEFYFSLPYQILNDADTEIDEKSVRMATIDWTGKTILIVEDTSSNYYLIENYLKTTGIKIFWAKSGREALDLFKAENKFDLVLMDIQLPGINGYEATKLIKAHNKRVPVIAQTAYALAGEREHSISEGCDDYIAKPIKKESLLELINKYLNEKP
jgi:CheY-like chemotaxis protein